LGLVHGSRSIPTAGSLLEYPQIFRKYNNMRGYAFAPFVGDLSDHNGRPRGYGNLSAREIPFHPQAFIRYVQTLNDYALEERIRRQARDPEEPMRAHTAKGKRPVRRNLGGRSQASRSSAVHAKLCRPRRRNWAAIDSDATPKIESAGRPHHQIAHVGIDSHSDAGTFSVRLGLRSTCLAHCFQNGPRDDVEAVLARLNVRDREPSLGVEFGAAESKLDAPACGGRQHDD
jgi:hypothetical protein